MKKIIRISLYIFLGSFIFIQFFRTEKNINDQISPNDFMAVNASLPESLQITLKTSCYDCHSNNTNYPWYASVAPFSWIIDQHIRNGKHELNFSEYDTLSSRQKIALLDEICEAISDSTMPPANYLMFHHEAALDFDDITALCDWADGAAFGILRKE